jgi:uncharacterized membrane protein
MPRNRTLDILRTLAIVLMVIFHFIYDLKFFGFVDWDTPDGSGWREFRWVIISLFFICLGVSLTFAHNKQYQWQKFFWRFAQIASAGIAISIVTYFAIPENWIFFGVLSFLAFASITVIGFVNHPKLSFCVGMLIIIVGALQVIPTRWPFSLMFDNLPSYTNDFVALFPWLGVVFLGVSLAHTRFMKDDPLSSIFKTKHRAGENIENNNHTLVSKIWVWPGQHSLSIYLLHQPILMGGLYMVTLML